MVLAFRQLYTSERFKPYVSAMEIKSNRISTQEKDAIIAIGDKTEGWLGVIERFIELSRIGMVSPKEVVVAILKEPEVLTSEKVPREITSELSVFIKSMWSSYFNTEAGRYGKNTLDKVLDISNSIEKQGLMDFILKPLIGWKNAARML